MWPPAVRLIILSLTKRRHINFYSDPRTGSIISLAREPLVWWLAALVIWFWFQHSGNGSVSCARLTSPWWMSCITPDGVPRMSILFSGSWKHLQIMLAPFSFWWIPQYSGNWPKPSELFTQATILFRDVVCFFKSTPDCSIFPKCIKIFFGWLNIPR